MPTLVRTFIAVRITAPAALVEVLAALSQMGRAVRPVTAGNLHITLRFLGGVEPATLGRLAEAVAEASAGAAPFDLQLCGLGAFPSARRPSVVWVGTGNDATLYETVRRLDEPIAAMNIGGDVRPWTSHMTLARVKARPPAELPALLARHGDSTFGAVAVESVDVMTSNLTPGGPVYRVAHAVRLADVDRVG